MGGIRDQVRFIGSCWDVSQKELKAIYLIKFDIGFLVPLQFRCKPLDLYKTDCPKRVEKADETITCCCTDVLQPLMGAKQQAERSAALYHHYINYPPEDTAKFIFSL